MHRYKVSLHRDYVVEIEARNQSDAMQLAEFFVGTPEDASRPSERKDHRFRILEIELMTNEAIEVEKLL